MFAGDVGKGVTFDDSIGGGGRIPNQVANRLLG
jgi:hypothetical protein